MKSDSANLDILRATAVLMVLVDHTLVALGIPKVGNLELAWLGRMGVCFFFVHTSLVLMLSLERTALSGWRLPANFYIRRAFRIYPLSCVTVVSIWLGGILFGPALSTATVVTNLGLVQNLFGAPNVAGPLWSLPVELDMYLLLPALFLIGRRYRGLSLALFWPAAIAGGLLFAHVYLPGIWRINVLYFAPCFVPGVMAYLISKSAVPRLPSWLWPVLFGSLTYAFLTKPGWTHAWFVCLPLGVAVPFFQESGCKSVTWLANRVAKYSYGIYLGHALCIWLAFGVMAQRPFVVQLGVFFTSIFLVPVLVFHVIEKPGIALGSRLAGRMTSNARERDQSLSSLAIAGSR